MRATGSNLGTGGRAALRFRNGIAWISRWGRHENRSIAACRRIEYCSRHPYGDARSRYPGKSSQWTLVLFGSYGSALEHANQPIVRCDFPIPPDVSPDGTSDWLFRVTGFFHS